MRVTIAAIVALLLGFIIARSAHSQMPPQCGPRDHALEMLARDYGEVVEARALMPDGRVLELLRAIDGATWTILISQPSGEITCMTASGDSWQSVPRQPIKGPEL